MSGALLLALLSALSAGERAPAALVTLVPPQAEAALTQAMVLEGVDTALRAHTTLALRSAEQLGLDAGALAACPRAELLGCITAHVGARAQVSVVAIVVVVPQGGRRYRLSLSLVDLGAAAARRAEASSGLDGRAALEDVLFAEAVHLEPTVLESPTPQALAAWIEGALPRSPGDRPWRQPLATLSVQGVEAPASVAIDGVSYGLLTPDDPRVVELRPGSRRVVVSTPTAEAHATLTLAAGRETELTLSWVERPSVDVPDRTRVPLALTGGLLVAGGTAVALVSGLAAASVSTRCVARPSEVDEASCGGLGGTGLGVASETLPSLDAAVVREGPPLVPLGVAAAAAGAALLVVQTLAYDPERSPWLELGLVLAAGALAGTAAALTL